MLREPSLLCCAAWPVLRGGGVDDSASRLWNSWPNTMRRTTQTWPSLSAVKRMNITKKETIKKLSRCISVPSPLERRLSDQTTPALPKFSTTSPLSTVRKETTHKPSGCISALWPFARRSFGPDHPCPCVAQSLNNLAIVYRAKGDYITSRAVASARSGRWREDSRTRPPRRGLISQRPRQYDREDAHKLSRRASVLWPLESRLSDQTTPTWPYTSTIAHLSMKIKRTTSKPSGCISVTLAIREKALGPNHPAVARFSLLPHQCLPGERGLRPSRVVTAARAGHSREGPWTQDHPDVADSLHRLSALSVIQHDLMKAIQYTARANEIDERNIALNLCDWL